MIEDVTGQPIAELSLVPKLFVTRAMSALRTANEVPLNERLAALADAGRVFASDTVGGSSADHYHHMVSRISGLPISAVRLAAEHIANVAATAYGDSAEYPRPAGAVTDYRDPLTRTGRAVWVRRGDVFAVHTPGNHPGVHSAWLEAVALGYRVAVRPSRREPLTPHRMVSSLRQAGFGDDQIVLLPTDHDTSDEILRAADLSMVYGGDEVMRKYAARSTVRPHGPGRSKILITNDVDWRRHLDMIVESISHDGGTGCINATAVFVQEDPGRFAQAIAERLSRLPSLPPEDEKAMLPVQPLDQARRIEQHLLASATGTRSWLGEEGIVHELGDGSAVLRPAVHQLDRPDAKQAGIELPFPCVWVLPWTAEAGVKPLKDTLVLTALTHDERLGGGLVADPTISNVHIGSHPTTCRKPGMPHDGFLAEFLMRTKGLIRGWDTED